MFKNKWFILYLVLKMPKLQNMHMQSNMMVLRRVGTQAGFGDEFIGGGGENAPRIAEQLQQMHGSFYTDARSHLKGNIFDGHSRE